MYDLVFDLTGIDLNTTTKAELHKETVDRSASVITFTPEAQEVRFTSHKSMCSDVYVLQIFCVTLVYFVFEI